MSTPLLAVSLVATTLLGLVIGSFINVVVCRVPAGIPLSRERRCPNCDARTRWRHSVPVVSWIALRGRCVDCRAPISARNPLVELVTGGAFLTVTSWMLAAPQRALGQMPNGAIAQWWAFTIVVLAYLYFVSISVALVLIDLDTHRLPNTIVLPSYVVAAALMTLACGLGADWTALRRAAVGMAAMFAFYALIRLISPRGMGGGDVKLAGVIGLYLGWIGWSSLLVGAFAAFALGGIFSIALMLWRHAGRKTAIPFAPWMILGAWIGVFTGGAIASRYLGLLLEA